MFNHTNGNGLPPVQAIRDYFYAVFSRIKDLIFNRTGRLQQPLPSFPRKPFSVAIALILGFLQVASQGKGFPAETPLFDSNPTLYYTAVTAFLIYCLACGFEIVSSSHPPNHIPIAARYVLHWCMFLAGSVSFAATASFLFPNSLRVHMFAMILFIIYTCSLLYWVYPFQANDTLDDAIV